MSEAGLLDRLVDFFVRNEDPRTKPWLLANTPGPLFTILITYLYFCLYAGPKYMKNRKPFELKNTLIIYNAIQVVLSIYLVVEGLEGGWRKHYNFKCQPVDYSNNPVAMRMARAVWLYYICKITELLDTVFFVLRKKQNQITFLHLYHHTLMPVCGFIGLKYFAGGHGTLLGLINSFIHVIMYIYYMLAAMGPNVQKHLWWKKYLTVMQIIQFLIVFVHTLQIQFQPSCPFPKSIGSLLTVNAGLFTYMFTSFYIRSYKRGLKPNTTLTDNNNDHSHSNGITANGNVTSSNGIHSNGSIANGVISKNGQIANGSVTNGKLMNGSTSSMNGSCSNGTILSNGKSMNGHIANGTSNGSPNSFMNGHCDKSSPPPLQQSSKKEN